MDFLPSKRMGESIKKTSSTFWNKLKNKNFKMCLTKGK